MAVADTDIIPVPSDGAEIPVERHPVPEAQRLLLWIGPEYGLREGQREMARRLAERASVEVWLADLLEGLFLTRGSDSMRVIDGEVVADLIEAACRRAPRVFLVSSSYGAIPVLRGARAWQARRPERACLAGGILFNPSPMAGLPPLGGDPPWIDEVQATSIPLLLLVGERHASRWRAAPLAETLSRGGATVWLVSLDGVTGLFYARRRPPSVERWFDRLPERLPGLLRLLESRPVPREALPLPARAAIETPLGIDTGLRPFGGDFGPRPVELEEIGGGVRRVSDYRGTITVVNFWATWCPPCVKEIPSLNRLQQRMAGLPFRLLSIDYAEPPGRVRKFLERVKVEFPVLLDRDGREAAAWKVIAFPSTYVIDACGEIRYAVNAAIEWDSDGVVERISALARCDGSPPRH